MALESKLEARDKEVEQLTRALEKSDENISSLESELQMCRSQQLVGSAALGTDSVQGRPSADDERRHDAGLTAVTSSCCSTHHPHHQTSDDTHTSSSSSESCRKKLKFTTDSCN